MQLEAAVKERLESRLVVVPQYRPRRQDELFANRRVTVMVCNL